MRELELVELSPYESLAPLGIEASLCSARAQSMVTSRYDVSALGLRFLFSLYVLGLSRGVHYFTVGTCMRMMGVAGDGGRLYTSTLYSLWSCGYIERVRRPRRDGLRGRCSHSYAINAAGRGVVSYYSASIHAVWNVRCRALRASLPGNEVLEAGANLDPALFCDIDPEDIILAGEHKYVFDEDKANKKRKRKKQ